MTGVDQAVLDIAFVTPPVPAKPESLQDGVDDKFLIALAAGKRSP